MDVKKITEEVICSLQDNAPLDSYMLKLRLIAKKMNNQSFSEFIEREFFSGYKLTSDVPTYRVVDCQLIYSGIVYLDDYGTSPISVKSDKINLREATIKESIPDILNLVKEDSTLTVPLTREENNNIRYHSNVSVHKTICRTEFLKIVQDVKTRLFDFILELNENMFDNQLDFSTMNKEKIEQIFNQTINTGIYVDNGSSVSISNSTVVGGSNNSVGISAENIKKLHDIVSQIETISSKIDELDEERNDIALEFGNMRSELDGEKRPNIIKSAFNSLKGIFSGAVKSAATKEMTDLIKEGVDLL